MRLWIHSTAGVLTSNSTELISARSDAVQPQELLDEEWNKETTQQPKCSQGRPTCTTKETSPEAEDCTTLGNYLTETPGFWNLSGWAPSGGYDELIRHYSCVVYLARPDQLPNQAQ